ncbi:MAG: glycerol-3-phosphate dehydrogenase [Gammaproteobacteria bacterium]|nr:glycerol-3-phosphate dehydrogenase [Gammaproteobacteria bacterium]
MDSESVYDILVVGGGINGVGIARDAAGRGLKVSLCEQDDLASHTSSASSKLVHGGLRYLEYYEFGLVRKSLKEREVVLRLAPHIVWPLKLALVHDAGQRPAWMIRLGLFLYDHLGGRELLPSCEGIDLHQHVAGHPIESRFKKGFVYSDCWVQDARLVVLNAMDAVERGAEVLTRTKCIKATRKENSWHAELQCADGVNRTISTRCIVNAAGPWVTDFIDGGLRLPRENGIRLVQGSHIVVPRMFEHEYAYLFQNADKRVVFIIPYEQKFTLIGTTDVDYQGDPADVEISAAEISYLCAAANRYFKQKLTAADVVSSYAGVRALVDDGSDDASAVTRDYRLELDTVEGNAPLLSVFGGKLTTYRKLAEHVMDELKDVLSISAAPWTAHAPLPGGDIDNVDFAGFLKSFRERHSWLPAELAWRYARNYGTRAESIIGDAQSLNQLGKKICADLYEVEARYLVKHEWARTADDILWRRTKLGLLVSGDDVQCLNEWLTKDLKN